MILICSVSVYFYRNQVANTPTLYFSGNQFVGDIEKDIAEMSSFDCSNCANEPEELFVKIDGKFNLFKKYSLIEPEKQKELMDKFVAAYAGKFFESTTCKFSKPWNFAKEEWRFKRVAWLLDSVGGNQLSPTIKANLQSIKQVAADYHSANSLLAQRSFSNMAEAKNRVALAKKYKEDKYLSNCGSLASSLSAYPTHMHNNHYSYVREMVEQMEMQIQILERLAESTSSKSSMSKVYKANFNRIYADVSGNLQNVRVALDDYDTKAQATYGLKKDVMDLSKRMGTLTQKFYSLPRPE